jgi:heavy metal sensor kinase
VRLSWGRLRARTRLTFWYALLLAGSLVALGGMGLWAVGRTLYANADELLRSKAAAVQTEVDFEGGRLVVELAGGPGTEPAAVIAGLDLVRVWDRAPRLVYQREVQAGLPPAEAGALDEIFAGRQPDDYATVLTGAGQRVRLYTEPIQQRDRIVGAIQVGRSEAEIEAVLAELRLFGAAGLLVALALAAGGGHFLAGRALSPVDQITRQAQRIGAEDLSRRLALPLPNDELGRLAAAFDGMIDRLEGAFQRQRQFTADASHELRTPLAIIRSQADVALSHPREAAYYIHVLTSIREESERLGRLAENLLVLARADAGQSVMLGTVDLEEIVAEAGAWVSPRARERDIRLAVEVSGGCAVRGDATWLSQLLLNLLDNALRYTPPGGRVRLGLRLADGGVAVEVADTGSGIGPEHLPHIFERFYRADAARTRADGAGLGLAICEWIAHAHGGRLEVVSVVDGGTSFTLWLPEAPPAPAPTDQSAPLTSTPSQWRPEGGVSAPNYPR